MISQNDVPRSTFPYHVPNVPGTWLLRLELVKDYNLEIHYHPGKANIVADALSRKSYERAVPKST
jgi:hypothetical protein